MQTPHLAMFSSRITHLTGYCAKHEAIIVSDLGSVPNNAFCGEGRPGKVYGAHQPGRLHPARPR